MFHFEKRACKLGLTALCVSALYACGGGGGGSAPVPAPEQPAAPAPTLAALITLDDGTTVGAATFVKGATATGGQGQPVQGLVCAKPAKSAPAAGYTHLNIVVDGQLVSVAENVGSVPQGSAGIVDAAAREVGCNYPLLTTDSSGKIRVQGGNTSTYTLGQFFAVWGQPLSTDNVAGYAGKPIKVFTKDGTTLAEYTGPLNMLPLTPNREITIQVGASLTQIPNFEWNNPPALSATPFMVRRGAFGEDVNGQLGLEGNQTNGRGGQGGVVDGLACAGPLNQNVFEHVYHAHAHLAIFRDGVRLAIPQGIGIVGRDSVPSSTCFYPLHGHDFTGTIHIEPANNNAVTLGQYFNIWGQPLTRTNVAGVTNAPVVVYVRDGGNLRRYQGDPAGIELKSNRSIIVQLGRPLNVIPAFEFDDQSQ